MSVVYYDTDVLARCPDPFRHVAKPITQVAGDVVAPYHGRSVQLASGPTFCGQWGSQPVRLPRLVIVNSGESKGFEPRRSSWAHVSEPIMSIHYNRAIFVETTSGLFIKFL